MQLGGQRRRVLHGGDRESAAGGVPPVHGTTDTGGSGQICDGALEEGTEIQR